MAAALGGKINESPSIGPNRLLSIYKRGILFEDKAPGVKKRGVPGVHEHFSPTDNAAMGQKGYLWTDTG